MAQPSGVPLHKKINLSPISPWSYSAAHGNCGLSLYSFVVLGKVRYCTQFLPPSRPKLILAMHKDYFHLVLCSKH